MGSSLMVRSRKSFSFQQESHYMSSPTEVIEKGPIDFSATVHTTRDNYKMDLGLVALSIAMLHFRQLA